MQPAPSAYRADIDGLRAISILLVLLFHGFPAAVPGGYIGVDVFLVISGYLITSQIHTQVEAKSFSFAGFYARRIRRIFPPLIAVLTFATIYGYWRLNLADFNALFRHIAAA
jgi:peptidoglycan/LPS O-acetylase OafA/YrhL